MPKVLFSERSLHLLQKPCQSPESSELFLNNARSDPAIMPGYPHFLILMGTQIQTFSGNPITAKGPVGKNNAN